MRGDITLIDQLVASMFEAVLRLEQYKSKNKIEDFSKIKNFILDLQSKISAELSKEFI